MDDLDFELEENKDLDNDNYSSDDDVLDRETKLPLVVSKTAGTKKYGYYCSTRICYDRLKEAMLHHRWQEAAEYMAYFPQVLNDRNKVKAQHTKELVWRVSTEILHHFPNATMEEYNNVYERMKHSGFKNYLLICMEKAFHLMLDGQMENAKQELSAGESWRYGKETILQQKQITLIQAYRSLLDYVIWCDVKSLHSDDPHFIDSLGTSRQVMQVRASLQGILKHPGVWDPLILCYIEILEFCNDHEEALKTLNNYAYDSTFPPNPNAHLYLYQYLKRHNAPNKKLLKVLKVLHALMPSHEMMLEYISLLLQSKKNRAAGKALEVTLGLLDFACWKCNPTVWRHLKASIDQLQSQENWEETVATEMAQRKDWWAAIHFTSLHARQDITDNPELFEIKSTLLEVLYPDRTLKYNTSS